MFLSVEASIACNPITSYHALQQSESDKDKVNKRNVVVSRNRTAAARIFTINTSEKNLVTCESCKKTGHVLHKCHKFIENPVAELVKFTD